MNLLQDILIKSISKNSRVIDLGCGEGELLEILIKKKGCTVVGIEKSFDCVLSSIRRGINVYQGDILDGIQRFESQSFDVAILSQTLQQVLDPIEVMRELCRISKIVIVTFPNFAHWRIRAQLLLSGVPPKTEQIPYDWHDTPNIRVITIKDFRRVCNNHNIKIVQQIPLLKTAIQRWLFPLRLTNLLTKKGFFIIQSKT